MAFLQLVLLLSGCLIINGKYETNHDVKSIFGWFSKPTTARPTNLNLSRSCNCVCGKKNDGSRVVGGTTTDVYEYPWMVRLSYFNKFYCGGTLINDRYVLTAAHCVKGFMWFLIKVTFGEHDMCDKKGRPESRFVLRATLGKFSYFNFDNDIAILRLNDRVPISDLIRPACLPTDKKNDFVGEIGTVTGWGTTKEQGPTSCLLQKADIPIMTNEECMKMNYTGGIVSKNMMCAGYKEGGIDSCQGDSGGPFVHRREDNKYEIIGVVSWGNGCARPGNPGVYTRVNRYTDWIKEHARDGCFCTAEKEEEEVPAVTTLSTYINVTTTETTVATNSTEDNLNESV